MRSFISYFLRLKGSAGRTAAALLICSKDRKILIKIKILKMRLRLPYETTRDAPKVAPSINEWIKDMD